MANFLYEIITHDITKCITWIIACAASGRIIYYMLNEITRLDKRMNLNNRADRERFEMIDRMIHKDFIENKAVLKSYQEKIEDLKLKVEKLEEANKK